MDAAPSFGALLRQWRSARRCSQLTLAADAEVSARHVSFLETGRARPSREMVLLLASALEVPLRERNTLLAAAGFTAAYTESTLDADARGTIGRALDWVLRSAEPYPAVVLNRQWDVVRTNRAANALFALLDPQEGGPNVLRLMFHPRGLRPWVANWAQVVPALLLRVRREAVERVVDEGTEALLAEVLPWLPPELRGHDLTVPSVPVVPVHFRKGDLDLRFVSTVTVLGTAQDITAQELRIESFFPADDATDARARALFGGL